LLLYWHLAASVPGGSRDDAAPRTVGSGPNALATTAKSPARILTELERVLEANDIQFQYSKPWVTSLAWHW
jgi:hypothetical protein